MTTANEADLIAVCQAGDGYWGDDDPDLDLVGACCAVEESFRLEQFAALELLLSYTTGAPPDDRLRVPGDPGERLRLAGAIITLGWDRAAPEAAP